MNRDQEMLKEVVEAADKMLSGLGKGRAPSPRLQAAMDEARRMLPGKIAPQLSPRDDDR